MVRRRNRVRAAMDLLEYQGKQLFARHGVPVSSGEPARTVEEAVAAAEAIGYPCVVKAQVQIGGRGKAGGIKLADDEAQAREHARAILGMDIRGLTVRELWIEARLARSRPSTTPRCCFDRWRQGAAGDVSTRGRRWTSRRSRTRTPEAIARLHVDPLLGLPGVPRPPARLRGRRRRRRRAPGRRDARRGSTRCSSARRRRWSRSTR